MFQVISGGGLRSVRIFVTFAGLSWQKGSGAQSVSLINEVRAVDRDAAITFESHALYLDLPHARDLGVAVVGTICGEHSQRGGTWRLLLIHLQLILWGVLKRLGLDWRRLRVNTVAQALIEADVVADLSGDSYRDPPGGRALGHNIWMLSAMAVGKPVVLVSQSLGPFRWYSRTITRFCLNAAQRIYIREDRTRALLQSLGVRGDIIHVAPDLAFRLPPAPRETVARILREVGMTDSEANDVPVVGMSTSALMQGLSDREGLGYAAKMTRVVQFIHRTHNAHVLLVPHVVHLRSWGKDDLVVANELYETLGRPEWATVIGQDLTASELKGVISRCGALLGARMHASIAALSSGVPTILLSWAHKYEGLMEHIGLPEFVWNFRDDVEKLEELFSRLWEGRSEIAKVLEQYNSQGKHAIREEMSSLVEIGRNHEAPSWLHLSDKLR